MLGVPGSVELSCVDLGYACLCWAVLSCVGLGYVVLCCAELCWALLGCAGVSVLMVG